MSQHVYFIPLCYDLKATEELNRLIFLCTVEVLTDYLIQGYSIGVAPTDLTVDITTVNDTVCSVSSDNGCTFPCVQSGIEN